MSLSPTNPYKRAATPEPLPFQPPAKMARQEHPTWPRFQASFGKILLAAPDLLVEDIFNALGVNLDPLYRWDQLEQLFSNQDTTKLVSFLDWYILVALRTVFDRDPASLEFQIKDLLGIESIDHIRNYDKSDKKRQTTGLFFEDFAAIVEDAAQNKWNKASSFAPPEQLILPFLCQHIKEEIEPEELALEAKEFQAFQAKSWKMDMAIFEAMDTKERILLKLRHNVISLALKRAGLLQQESPIQFEAALPPGLPSWMPNGGHTCFISATLWPLFLLFKDEISDKSSSWPKSEEATSLDLARQKFSSLYQALGAKERKDLSQIQVKEFRLAIQQAFSFFFENADEQISQEDAQVFLILMMDHFLELDHCLKNAPKFHICHEYTRSDDSPLKDEEDYDYQSALAPSYTATNSCHLICKDEAQTGSVSLNALVTEPRQTHVFGKEVHRHGESSGKDLRSIAVSHHEYLVVESKEKAPPVFIGSLNRFSHDLATGETKKRTDPVALSESLEFRILGEENSHARIAYDLVAVTVHQGEGLDSGHYYTYIRYCVDGKWTFFKYDDLRGTRAYENDQLLIGDISHNGYLFYYRKRKDGEPQPDPFKMVASTAQSQEELDLLETPSTNRSSSPVTLGMDLISSVPLPPFFTDAEILNGVGSSSGRMDVDRETDPLARLFKRDSQTYPDVKTFLAEKLFLFLGDFPEDTALRVTAEAKERSIYVVAPGIDKDLQFVEGLPIPGDGFCYHVVGGEENILFLFKNPDGSVVELISCF